MTNKLSRNEFMKSGIVAALGMLVPKPIVSIIEKFKSRWWPVKTQAEFLYALDNVGPGDTIMLAPDTWYYIDRPITSDGPMIMLNEGTGLGRFSDCVV